MVVLYSAQLGAGTVTLKMFRSLKLRKPVYTAVFSGCHEVRLFRRGYGEILCPQRKLKVVTGMLNNLSCAEPLMAAMAALLREGLNIAYAPLMVSGDAEWIDDRIAFLPAKHREAATRAHALLTAELGCQ